MNLITASTPAPHRLASWLCHPHLAEDPVPGQGARHQNGSTTPPTTPGIGVTPPPDTLGPTLTTYPA